jgi:ABC-type xylose transport system permease subunit
MFACAIFVTNLLQNIYIYYPLLIGLVLVIIFGHIQRAQGSLSCTACVVADMTLVDWIHQCLGITKIKMLESLKLAYSEIQCKIILIRH